MVLILQSNSLWDIEWFLFFHTLILFFYVNLSIKMETLLDWIDRGDTQYVHVQLTSINLNNFLNVSS